MPLNPKRVLLAAGCFSVILLAALSVLSLRTEAPAARKVAQAPPTPLVAATVVPDQAPVADAPRAHVVSSPDAEAASPSGRSFQAGMMAYLDPESGQLVSQPTEGTSVERLSIPLERTPDANFTPVTLAQGGVMVELDESFQDFAIVRIDASGKLRMDCLSAPDAAKALKTQPAVPAALPEE